MAHDRFDEHALVVLARRTRKHQAEVCQERIRSIEKRARASFVELGILVSHVERYEKIDEAIAAAMLIYELPNREAALECIAAWFMDAQVDSEDYQGLSHREAYENRTLTPRAQTMAAHA